MSKLSSSGSISPVVLSFYLLLQDGGPKMQAQAKQSSSSSITNETQQGHLYLQDSTRGRPDADPPGGQHQQLGTDTLVQQQQQQRPIPRIIMRTVFFDGAVLAAVGTPASRSLAVVSALMQRREQQKHPPCTQVCSTDSRLALLLLFLHVVMIHATMSVFLLHQRR